MGKLSLNSKLFNSIIFKPFESKNIVFKGPSGTTMGNFINAFDIFNVDSNGIVNMFIGSINTSPLITFISNGSDWLNLVTEVNLSNYVIPLNAIFQINSTSNVFALFNLGGNAIDYFQGQAFIKKQNLSTLKSSNFYSPQESTYIFKSATTNLLSQIFNTSIFQNNESLFIYYQGSLSGLFEVFVFDGANWINAATFLNGDNYVIPANSLITLSLNSNRNITVGGGAIIQKYYSGKISLFFDTLPLNTQSIKLNLSYEIGGCGNDFVLTQNGVWSQNGCDFYVRWDNKDGTLPYKWRFYYSSDGRTDYASHPTAGPDALPKKGWSNGMTISENQLITFGQSLVLNNLPFDVDANCNFSIFNRTWIYLGAPSFRYRPIDNLSYHINTPLTPDGYGGNGSYQIASSDEVYFTNGYSNSDKFPSNNWQLASYIINTCPQITTTPIFSLL